MKRNILNIFFTNRAKCLACTILVIMILLIPNVGVAQYWGDQMMDSYSESLSNGQIGVLKSSKQVAIDNEHILITDAYGVSIVNISNPALPQHVNRIGTPGRSNRLVVANGYAYIADEIGMSIVNYTNPSNLKVESFTQISGSAHDIDVFNNKAFISTKTGLIIFDVANPIYPLQLSEILIDNHNSNHNLTIHKASNILYYTTGRHLYVIDISIITQPQILSSYEFNHSGGPGTCHDGPKLSGD